MAMHFLPVFALLCASLPCSQQFGYNRPEEYTVCYLQGFKCYAEALCGPEDGLSVRHYCQYGEKCCRYKPCISNSDCASRSNSHCHQRRCRCDIGYGLDGDICRDLRECTSFSNIMTVYDGYASWGYNLGDYYATYSAEVCQQLCLDNQQCVSSELDNDFGECYFSAYDWLDVHPDDRGINDEDYDYYQRECNW